MFNNSIKSYIFLFLIISIYSCQHKDNNSSPILTEEQKVDSLIHIIEKNQYHNLKIVEPVISELLLIKDNDKAQLLGSYYKTKSNFFKHERKVEKDSLANIYNLLSNNKKEYEFAKIEIDIALAISYYGVSDFDAASERIKLARSYILDEKYDIERTSMIYGLTSGSISFDYNDRLEEIKEVIESFKDRPWSFHHVNLHYALAVYQYKLKQKEEGNKALLYIIETNKEHNLLALSIHCYNSLAYRVEQEKAIYYSNKAIEIARQTGHTSYIMALYRVLGHLYMNENNFKDAYLNYNKAIHYDTTLYSTKTSAIDYAYAGWAYFKMDTLKHFEEANTYFTKAIEYADDHSVPKKMALQRKMWACSVVGKKSEITKIEKELKSIIPAKKTKNAATNFYLNTTMKIEAQNNKINNLTISNQLKKEKIFRQNFIIVFIRE